MRSSWESLRLKSDAGGAALEGEGVWKCWPHPLSSCWFPEYLHRIPMVHESSTWRDRMIPEDVFLSPPLQSCQVQQFMAQGYNFTVERSEPSVAAWEFEDREGTLGRGRLFLSVLEYEFAVPCRSQVSLWFTPHWARKFCYPPKRERERDPTCWLALGMPMIIRAGSDLKASARSPTKGQESNIWVIPWASQSLHLQGANIGHRWFRKTNRFLSQTFSRNKFWFDWRSTLGNKRFWRCPRHPGRVWTSLIKPDVKVQVL